MMRRKNKFIEVEYTYEEYIRRTENQDRQGNSTH